MPICLNQPISHGREHLQTVPLPPRKQALHPLGLSLGTFNIRNARGSRILQDIWVVQIGISDLMISTETNITDHAYCCNKLGYDVVCLLMRTKADSGYQVGVCLVIRDWPQVWSLDQTRLHESKLMSCKVVTNRISTLIIREYFPPSTLDHSTLEHLTDLEEALTRFCDQYPIVLGDLRPEIFQAQNPHSQQVSDLLMKFGLMDLLRHFGQSGKSRHTKTWSWARQGIVIRERSDCILETDWRRFEMVWIGGIRNKP